MTAASRITIEVDAFDFHLGLFETAARLFETNLTIAKTDIGLRRTYYVLIALSWLRTARTQVKLMEAESQRAETVKLLGRETLKPLRLAPRACGLKGGRL